AGGARRARRPPHPPKPEDGCGAGAGQPDAEWVLRARQGAGPSKQRPAQQGPGIFRLTGKLGAEWLPAWSTASTVKRCAVGAGPTTGSRKPNPAGALLVPPPTNFPRIRTP